MVNYNNVMDHIVVQELLRGQGNENEKSLGEI